MKRAIRVLRPYLFTGIVLITSGAVASWAQPITGPEILTGSPDYKQTVSAWLEKKEPKIVGGKPANEGDYPWQVSLDVSWIADQYRAHFCGGSIYSAEWIVTAAHCVDGNKPQDIIVTAGTNDLTKGGIRRNVKQIFVFKGYAAPQQGKDVALLHLWDPLPLGPRLRAIPLLEQDAFTEETRFTVTGWGATTEGGQQSRTLQFLDNLPYVASSLCNQPLSYDGKIKADMICAGFAGGRQDSCQGDSGGPLAGKREDVDVLAGIVSWGDGCARPLKYGIYTRVSSYADWIKGCSSSPTTCERK